MEIVNIVLDTAELPDGIDIPVLNPTLLSTDPNQYFYVEISGLQNERVTFAIRMDNLYLVGYRVEGNSYFLRDPPQDLSEAAQRVIFPNTARTTLPYRSAQYPSLEAEVGETETTRRDIPLGIQTLGQQINSLYHGSSPLRRSSVARALIVVIQMVCEAVRYRNIRQEVIASIHTTSGTFGVFYPSALLMEYQTNWGTISEQVLSARDGVFNREVRLNLDGTPFIIRTVRQVIFLLALMPRSCLPNPRTMIMSQLPFSSSSLRRSLLLPEKSDQICHDSDPTTYITGLNGLCVDVYGGSYQDGNSIILSQCRNRPTEQLWTLKRDGTFRSKDKCLTAYGYRPGSYVMIYDCRTAVPEATKWAVWSNGSIIHPRSGLVLAATKWQGTDYYSVVVSHNTYKSSQAWYVAEITEPRVKSIVNFNSLCLLGSGTRVWLEQCLNDHDVTGEQQWALYSDGTVRPSKNQDRHCLKYQVTRNLVNIGTCDGGPEERWFFQNDGTILHLATGLVMDVNDKTNPLQPTVGGHDPSNRFTQIWYLEP